MKKLLFIASFLLLLGGTFYLNQAQTSQEVREEKPEVGFIAPDFSLTNEKGELVTLSQYRGKPIFINFWASWCPPCKAEMPDINTAYKSYKDEIVFLGVNVTASDIQEEAINFMKINNYKMPVLYDLNGNVANTYRAASIPTSYFIDKNGVIKKIVVGAMTFDQIEANLKLILEE